MYHNSVNRFFNRIFNPFLPNTGLKPNNIIEGSQRDFQRMSIETSSLPSVNLDAWANNLPTGTEIPFDRYYDLPEHLKSLFNRIDKADSQMDTDYHYFKKPSASEVARDLEQRKLSLENFVRSLPTGTEIPFDRY